MTNQEYILNYDHHYAHFIIYYPYENSIYHLFLLNV